MRLYRRVYARFLVRTFLKPWNRRLWNFQAAYRKKLDVDIGAADMLEAVVYEVAGLILSPTKTARSLRREYARATQRQ